MKRWSLVLFLALVCLPLAAQQMSVEDFTRLKGRKVEKDKAMALLDLVTDEKGFTFVCDGNQPVEAKEGEGVIQLRLPHRTTHLSIRHPAYGQLAWLAPKPLKRRMHYQAQLYASDPTKEVKATHQWVVFHLNPENTLVQIDSVQKPVRSTVAAYYLPVGDHTYRVEAPFYEPVEAGFTLTDSLRENISVELQPFYSFLTVKTEWQGGDLYIDGSRIRPEESTSYRLADGHHRVSYFWSTECFYDTLLYVGKGQKQVLELKVKDLRPLALKKTDPRPMAPPDSAASPSSVKVKFTSADPDVEILVDRECVGKGSWEGSLPLGFHLAGARKNGLEGPQTRLMLEDSFPREIVLMAPGAGSGLVNIQCNVPGARILVDGEDRGSAPQLLQLNASHTYEIILYRAGYKDHKVRVRPKAQGQTEVNVKLKKR